MNLSDFTPLAAYRLGEPSDVIEKAVLFATGNSEQPYLILHTGAGGTGAILPDALVSLARDIEQRIGGVLADETLLSDQAEGEVFDV